MDLASISISLNSKTNKINLNTKNFYRKKVVQLLLRSDLNFDKSTLTGKADLTKRIYQNFDGYESVIINTGEFEAIQEHAGRVSFLVESGKFFCIFKKDS